MQKLLKHTCLVWILFILIFITSQPQIIASAQSAEFTSCMEIVGIPADECDILEAFFNSTNGASWTNHTNWLATNTPADWFGVTVTQIGGAGHVTQLILPTNNLTGEIPDLSGLSNLTSINFRDNNLAGAIPSSLGDLPGLVNLDISSNQLTGNIPSGLLNSSNLNTLNLASNQLSGEIPDISIENASSLGGLILSRNQLSGSIPSTFNRLSELSHLEVAHNQLSGEIPPIFGSLPDISVLNLSYNQLSGVIPISIGQSSNLTVLNLSNNQLSGNIPELGGLLELTQLSLSNNQLAGEFPYLENLTNLESLHLYQNQLSGPLPGWLGNLQKLSSIGLANNQFSGEIPTELGTLLLLNFLDLSDNQLSGSIPASLGNLSDLFVLDLSSNQLTSNIPLVIGNLANLTYLDLSDNQLTGSIPIGSGQLLKLTILNLSDNQLSGSIPEYLGAILPLTQLALFNNQLDGRIPDVLVNLTNLEWLLLSKNQLSGPIPTWIGSLSRLTRLELAQNEFTGGVPVELGNLTLLTILDLSSNQLTGPIPPELGNLSQLTQLNLSTNQLSGNIPPHFGGLHELTNLDLSNNQLTETIPDFEQLSELSILNLANNQLSGSIPDQFGALSKLSQLSLSNNLLQDEIPDSLGNLLNLETLLLNQNHLTGAIPTTVGNLSKLTHLDLSDNQLSGEIPDQLGSLSTLLRLALSNNQLVGDLPGSLGGIPNLESILVEGNSQLTGSIPLSFINLINLHRFYYSGTSLCEPLDRAFYTWKATVGFWIGTGEICGYSDGVPINGRVTDQNGNALVGVVISAVGPSSTVVTANSQNDGNYQLLIQQPGIYQLTPTKSGYLFYPPSLIVQVYRERDSQNFRGRITTCYSPTNPNGQTCANQPSAPFLQLPFHLGAEYRIDRVLQDEDLGGLITSWFDHKASSGSMVSSIELYDGESYTSSLATSLINGVACFDRHCAGNQRGIGIKPPSGSATTNVYPAADGTITEICNTGNCGRDTSLGRYVVIQHANRLYATLYAHLASIPSGLATGRTVGVNTPIGTVGGSGGKPVKENYWPRQLYFAVFFNGAQANSWTPNAAEAVDPFGWRSYDERADDWKMPSVPLWSDLHSTVSEAPGADSSVLSSGSVTITVQLDSLAEGQILTIADSSLGTKLNPGLRSIEQSFHVKIFDSLNGWSIRNPLEPLEVQVDYSQADLTHLNATEISLYRLVSQTWTPIGTGRADNIATASLSSSGKFALAAPLLCPLDTQEPYDDQPDLYKQGFQWENSETIERIFDTPTDQDWVAVDMIAGATYTFTTQHSNTINSILTLFGGDGRTQFISDDPTNTQTAHIEWKAAITGTYYLRISQASGSAPACEPYSVIQDNSEKSIFLPVVHR